MHGPPAAHALPFRLKLAWAAGSLGTVTQLYLVNLLLLFFLTRFAGLAPALAGAIIFAGRLYDVFADPAMGAISDRTVSRMGRRRPWMLAGALLSGLSCVALFTVPVGLGHSGAVAWAIGAVALYFTGYTMFNIPYLSMPAEMTDDYDERTRIMSYRVAFVSVAGILGLSLAPLLVKTFGGAREAYASMSMVMAIVITAPMLVAVAGTRDAPQTAHRASSEGLAAWIRSAMANAPFLLLVGIKFLHLLALSSVSATLIFFVVDLLGRDQGTVALFGLVSSVATMLALPLWVKAAVRFSKPLALMWAVILQAAITLTWLAATPAEPPAIFVLRSAALGLASAGVILMGQALLPDAIGYDRARTGLNREGIFAALYSLAEKSAFAAGPLVIGLVLSFAGYEADSDERGALHIGMAIVPALAYLASIPLIVAYRRLELRMRKAA